MNGSDLLIVLRTRDSGTGPSQIEGYRLVRTAASGSIEFFESDGPGERIDRVERGPHLVWVSGVTTSTGPAGRLAGWGSAFDPRMPPTQVPLVGHFLAAVLSPESVTLWTDHVGTVPLFRATARDGSEYVGSDLWTVATLAERTTLDPVSAREFLGRGAVSSPFTILADVTRVPAAARVVISAPAGAPDLRHEHYWRPSPDGAPTDLREAAEALRSAVTSFVAGVVRTYPDPLVLLSGGEDSRVLAALARRHRPRGELRAAIFLDHPNRELRLAQASATLLGARLEPRWRPAGQYTADLARRIRVVGPGFDQRHAHAWGLVDPARDGLLIDGFGSDLFTKATVVPSRPRHPGRPWSRRELDLTGDWRSAVARTQPTVLDGIIQGEEVADRRRGVLQAAQTYRPDWDAATWTRFWPLTDWVSGAFFVSNWTQLPSASPFLTGPTVDAIKGLPEHAKLNRVLFQAAFARSLGPAGLIPRSGGELPGVPGPLGRGLGALVGGAFERSENRAHRRGDVREQGPWMAESAIQAQALRLLECYGQTPADVSRNVLIGPDRREQVLGHPAVASRLLQLVVMVEELGVTLDCTEAVSSAPPATSAVANARGAVLHVDLEDRRGRALVEARGDLNPASLVMWERIISARSWDLVVDVGANYGEMLLGVDLPGRARVIAYEPNPTVRDSLVRSVQAAEAGVEVRPVAVSDRPGTATLMVDPGWSGTARLADGEDLAGWTPITVNVVTLDAELGGSGARTACVKVDVEGAEAKVVAGAAGLLRSLEDYCCLIEILHLSDEAVAMMSQGHALYLWDLRRRGFSRVGPCTAQQVRSRLASGAYYTQDVLIRPKGSSLPEALR